MRRHLDRSGAAIRPAGGQTRANPGRFLPLQFCFFLPLAGPGRSLGLAFPATVTFAAIFAQFNRPLITERPRPPLLLRASAPFATAFASSNLWLASSFCLSHSSLSFPSFSPSLLHSGLVSCRLFSLLLVSQHLHPRLHLLLLTTPLTVVFPLYYSPISLF